MHTKYIKRFELWGLGDEIISRLNIRGEVGTPLLFAKKSQTAFAGQALSRFPAGQETISSILPPEMAGFLEGDIYPSATNFSSLESSRSAGTGL